MAPPKVVPGLKTAIQALCDKAKEITDDTVISLDELHEYNWTARDQLDSLKTVADLDSFEKEYSKQDQKLMGGWVDQHGGAKKLKGDDVASHTSMLLQFFDLKKEIALRKVGFEVRESIAGSCITDCDKK
jgi:hypothetical protein